MRSRVVSIGVTAAAMAFSLSCSSGQTSVAGPSNSKCQIQVSNSPTSFPAAGGTGTVAVSTTGDCTWTVTSDAAWVSITGNPSGQGDATVAYSVAPNPAPSQRSGGIGVSPNFMRLSQAAAPCIISLDRSDDSIGAPGGHLSFGVSTLTGCGWSASTSASWISITSGQSGNGNGSVALSIAANTGLRRIGQVHVAGQTYTVAQSAAPTCVVSLSRPGDSIAATGGNLSFDVSTPTGCSWSASTSDSWISIGSGQSGSGNGTVALSIAANTGPQRAGQVHVAGQTYTVTQAAAPPGTLNGQVSGLLGVCPLLTFDVSGKTVVTSPTTVFRGEPCNALRNGQTVAVTGVTQVDQTVLASTVELVSGQ